MHLQLTGHKDVTFYCYTSAPYCMHSEATLEHYTPFVEHLYNIRIITKYNFGMVRQLALLLNNTINAMVP